MHERVFVFLQKLNSSCLPHGPSLRPGSRAVGQAPGPLLCPLLWWTLGPQTPLDPGRKADGTPLGALRPELQRPIPAPPACAHFLPMGSSRLHLTLCEPAHLLTSVCVFTFPKSPSLGFGGPVFTKHGGPCWKGPGLAYPGWGPTPASSPLFSPSRPSSLFLPPPPPLLSPSPHQAAALETTGRGWVGFGSRG